VAAGGWGGPSTRRPKRCASSAPCRRRLARSVRRRRRPRPLRRGRRGIGWGGVIRSSTRQCEAEPRGGAPLCLPYLRAGGAGLARRDRPGGADEARGGARVRRRDL